MARIPLQTAYFRFVVKYVGYDYEFASAVFKKLSEIKNYTKYSNILLEKFTLSEDELNNPRL